MKLFPAVVVRLSGFAFSRLDSLRLTRAARAVEALKAAAALRSQAAARVEQGLAQQRLREHAAFDEPETRTRLRGLLRRLRRFTALAQGEDLSVSLELPEEGVREAAAALPSLAAPLEELRSAAKAVTTEEQALATAFAQDLEGSRTALRRLYAEDERLREAVFLESAEAYQRIAQLTSEPEARTSRRKQRERLAALYAQRFFAKNDTNSLCGPHGLVLLDPHADHDFVVLERELAQRRSYFSHWAAERLLPALAQRAGVELPLRRNPAVRLEAEQLSWCTMEHDATRFFRRRYARARLPAELGELLSRVDGSRTRSQLTALESGSELALEELEKAQLVHSGLQVPVGAFDPLGAVGSALERWPQPARAAAQASVAELRGCVEAFSGAGLPEKVVLSARLEAEFTALTGSAASRGAGEHYADRSLLHEDCHAQMRAGLTPRARSALTDSLNAITAAASLPMELSREQVRLWFSERFGRGRRVSALEVHRAFDEGSVLQGPDTGAVRASMERVRSLIASAADAARGGVASLSPRELLAAVGDLPALARPGYASADIMWRAPAAAGDDAAFIVSEMHGFYLLPTCLLDVAPEAQREDVLAQMRALLRRLASGRRTVEPLFLHTQATDRRFPVTDADLTVIGSGDRPGAHAFGALDMVLDDELRFLAGQEEVVPITVYLSSPFLQYASAVAPLIDDHSGKFFPSALLPDEVRTDGPRLTVGGVVLRRATRQRRAGDVAAQLEALDERALFVKAQRLGERLGLGQTVFASVPGQPKPVLVDFENFFLVEAFARLAERTPPEGSISFSEMLPGPSELFLQAPDGLRTFELRMGLYREPAGT